MSPYLINNYTAVKKEAWGFKKYKRYEESTLPEVLLFI